MIFGYLVLSANTHPTKIESPRLDGSIQHTGQHVVGKRRGLWLEATTLQRRSIYIPQRYKKVEVTATDCLQQLCSRLETLDSEMENARQLFKLNALLSDTQGSFAAVVNNIGTADKVSGSFYLLAKQEPIYVNIVIDNVDHSTRLVWSTFDLKTDLQDSKQFRYIIYPLPTICNRPLFVSSQSACSRWWRFTTTFGSTGHGLLRSCNALEMYLYKDPNLATL